MDLFQFINCFNSYEIRLFVRVCVLLFFFSSPISFYILRELDLVSKSRSYSAIAQQYKKKQKEKKKKKKILFTCLAIYIHIMKLVKACAMLCPQRRIYSFIFIYIMLTMCIQLCNDHMKKKRFISFTNIRICLFMDCSTIDMYKTNKTTTKKKCFKC